MISKARASKQSPRMSHEAVKAKTGKAWKEWFAILDRAGARKMSHQEIVSCISTTHDVGRGGSIGPNPSIGGRRRWSSPTSFCKRVLYSR